MNYLLDTCTFLWFISGSKEIPLSVKEVICDPENDVYLSVVSYWEVLVKEKISKFKFPLPATEYIIRQRKNHFIESLLLNEESLQYLPKLPDIHRDPFDRMLVCQALHHGMSLITPDRLLHAYPVKILWE